ncbi:hypothetical protein AXF42_Ash019421 [Apostasia shenzhenica]|uniref:Uncharacterized protein n=1 Tax=Apostasia shenzhenica TaxID=1088818 RepID=A0A2I0B4X1_9ASPA|nr:hypothetical protein AXF42_Ash019421 [Apostasia shenzhenica]
MAERKWKTMSGFSRKRAGAPLVDAPLGKKMSEAGAPLEAEAPTARVAVALAQTLELLQGLAGTEAADVVAVSDSPVKPPLKAKGLQEVVLVAETTAGEKLAPGKVLVKDEELERLLPRFGVPSLENQEKGPTVICRPALGTLVPAPEKKKKHFFLSLPPLDFERKGEKSKKSTEEGSDREEGTQGKKEETLVAAPAGALGIEGLGDKMGEATKEKGETLSAAPSAKFGEIWGTLGERLSEIRRAEEKILGNTSETLEVVKTLKGREDVEARCLREVRELEGALSQATEHSLADQRGQLEKMFQMEDRLASLAQLNAE